MVPIELLTVPLDFQLILLVNGTPTAEFVPIVIDQGATTEQRESFLQCQMVTGSTENPENRPEHSTEFFVATTDFIENMNTAFSAETDSEITLQLAPNPVNRPGNRPQTQPSN